MTCHVDLDAEVAVALSDLIDQHINKYSLRSQAFLVRASKALDEGMQRAADAL